MLLAALLLACSDSTLTKNSAEPQAAISSHADGQQVEPGETLSLLGRVWDDDDPSGDLEVTWYVDGAEACPALAASEDGTTTCQAAAPDSGAFTVVLEVRDPGGATGDDSVTLEAAAAASTPPSVSITAPVEGGDYYVDERLTFEGTATDAEGEPGALTVTWTSDRDGDLGLSPTPDASGAFADAAELSQGQHYITLTATDTAGLSSTDGVLITVLGEDQPPSASIELPQDGRFFTEGEAVTFQGSAADDRDAPEDLSARWSSDLDGVLSTDPPGADGVSGFTLDTLSGGAHRLTFEVTDSGGQSASDTVSVYVNGAPSAPAVAIQPAEPGTHDSLTVLIEAESVDPDGDTVSYSYQWYLDGALSPSHTGTTVVSDDTDVGQTWSVRVTPSDPLGEGPYGEASVTVANSAPSAPAVSLSPAAPTTADDLRVSVDIASVDDDGDSVSYSYAWLVDGAPSKASTGATLPSAATTAGQTWTVRVTPSDGVDDGPYGEDSVTVGNSPPGAPEVSISPESPDVDDTLTASVDVDSADADGDSVSYSYAWLVDGAATAFTGATVPASATGNLELWTVRVTPNDGTDDGPYGEASVTVGNAPPSAPGVTITPVSPIEGVNDLTCAVTTPSDDAEGDAVTYGFAWDVDGAAYGGAADGALSSVVDAAETAAGETWTCTVTPDDGTSAGASGSDSVLILEDTGGVEVEGDRLVFVTSGMYDGDLGGLAGADAICQDHADAAALGGTWRAWLSDSTADARDRLNRPTGNLLRVDGQVVATSWDDLVASWPLIAPEIDENGDRVPYDGGGSTTGCSWSGGYFFFPWTATDNEGYLDGQTCDDWTSASSGLTGRVGLGGYSLSQWSTWCDFPCDWEHHLYCFEQ